MVRGVGAALLRGALLVSSVSLPALAQADEFQGLGVLRSYSIATGVSGDGTVVVGYADSTAVLGIEAFRWSGGVMTGLGLLPGGTASSATAVNADGSVVVGFGRSALSSEAFRWTGGVMTGLGFLPGGTFSQAYGVSADGTVVVGTGNSTAVPSGEAFRWTGGVMTGLGLLPGGTYSYASGVSADGAVVVGYGNSTAGPSGEAFRWSGGVMTGLGFLPGGTFSIARGVSADGAVVVGVGNSTAGPSGEAFRWTGGVMTGLGFLPGGTLSGAFAVNADGSVVVGFGDSTANPSGEAFRWTSANGMQSVRGLLVAAGIDMTGWTLETATGVSSNGSVIVGTGQDPSFLTEAWIARLCDLPGSNCPGGSGVITVDVAARSFAGLSALGKTGNAAIGGGLGLLTQVATESGLSQQRHRTPFSVFSFGGYDSDPAASGTLGLTADLPQGMLAGVAVSAHYVKTDMVYDGSAKMTGGSAGAFLARVPQAGLQWLLAAEAITLSGDVTRGYLNGSGPASSTGSTSAHGYGVTARAGWTFDNVWRATQVTPFASYTYSRIHIDGYTERGGAFPAQFAGFADEAQTARLGADARYTFAPGQWMWGTLAWAHRLDGGKSGDVTGTLIGLFPLTVQGFSVATDWAEVTGGFRTTLWKNGAFTASVTASMPERSATTYVARAGITESF